MKTKRVEQAVIPAEKTAAKPAVKMPPDPTIPGIKMKPGSDQLGFDENGDDPPLYIPKRGEVAGFELHGYRQPDGTIRLGSDDKYGTALPEFPGLVEVAGAEYRLEYINQNVDAKGEVRNNMEWGVYC